MVVGLFASVRYERGHVKLHPGDMFVACTDGITEAIMRRTKNSDASG